ncbi:MAG TPA: DUF3592 domain-containing protein [Ktedonobacteraceae bacterium]|jgi:hypothetical protein|nr:DUF3592 domain-containing protein [Ktedonobacteraceae bacterium]
MSALIMLLFVVIIVVVIVSFFMQQQKVNWLEQNGKRVMATVTEVEVRREAHQVARMQQQATLPNAPPSTQTVWETQWSDVYYVHAQWTDPQTGQVYNFKSDQRAFWPSIKQGETVEVLFDPNDPSRYHIKV